MSTDCPLRVKSYVLTLGPPLPLYPDQRTSSYRSCWSGSCQQETHAPQQFNSLFNHLVGPGEQVRWDSQIHRAGGLQVDAEYDAGRLDEGQFGDLGAAQQ